MRAAILLLAALPLLAADPYRISVASFAAASAFDAGTSYGQRESNALLAGHAGRFTGQSVAIKAGIVAGIFAVERLTLRKRPGARRWFAALNFALAGETGFVGARNLGRRR